MRLKKIILQGFKSFADRTVINFHEGITGIVGPNGCGKSNISDAFRWVLGEKSAKSMRGKEMADVIFAGTNVRKPLNFAEVTLVMDEVQGELPIEFDEVAVTRRVHRSGESDYLINKQQVRLKDVNDLFLDSGIGKSAFSIFEQGKIDQVINYTPYERRCIFEDAAGILRFLQRKREALRKLQQTEQNMNRVKDIHREVEQHITVLEQQAEKAKHYKDDKVVLEKLERALFGAKGARFQKRLKDLFEKEREKKEEIQQLSQEVVQLQKELAEAKELLQQGQKEYRAKSEEVYRRKSEKEIHTKEKESNQERFNRSVALEKKRQEEIEQIRAVREEREKDAIAAKQRQQTLSEELKKKQEEQEVEQEKVSTLEKELSLLYEQQREAQTALYHVVQKEKTIEGELKQAAIKLESHQERVRTIEKREIELARLIEEGEQEVAKKQEEMLGVLSLTDEKKARYRELEAKLKELNEDTTAKRRSLDELLKQLTENEARQKALIRLREDMEGFSEGSKQLLKEAVSSESVLFGKLKGIYEYITPLEGGEEHLSRVMQPYAETLVVETKEDRKTVLSYAEENGVRDFSLICLEELRNCEESLTQTEGVVPLIRYIADGALSKHFVKDVYLVDSIETATQQATNTNSGQFLIRSGFFFDRHRVLFSAEKSESNVFLREAELKTLTKEIKGQIIEKTALDEALQTLFRKTEQLQEERTALDKEIRVDEMQHVEMNFDLQRKRGDLDRAQCEKRELLEERTHLNGACQELNKTVAALQVDHQTIKKTAEDAERQLEQMKGRLDRLTEHFKQETATLKEKDAALRILHEESRKLVHALHVIEVKDAEGIELEKRLQREIAEGKVLQEEIRQKAAVFEEKMQSIMQALEDEVEALKLFDQEVEKRAEAIQNIESLLDQKHVQMKGVENEQYHFGMKRAQIEAQLEAVTEELSERFDLKIEEIEEPLEKSIEQTEREVRAIRNRVEGAGDINMTSIEEFEKHKERYAFLNQQIADIAASQEELVKVIAQLDEESRKVFKETFDKIQVNFRKNFELLFKGGEADLQFTEAEDLLEAGIEIIAKPPGKQMRSINLLSGGEKCLTAIALLFAVFEVKPSPFCILDEIDAPLDDTNIERFVKVVKQFVSQCQFIIITHNKRTMAIADILFGVSMEEKGVSKLLSFEFSEAAPQLELV